MYDHVIRKVIRTGGRNVWSIELLAEDRLESVEADMAELEIDTEDVHDRKKECYEEEVQLYRKLAINRQYMRYFSVCDEY